jgi:hypothetical protein
MMMRFSKLSLIPQKTPARRRQPYQNDVKDRVQLIILHEAHASHETIALIDYIKRLQRIHE